MIPRYAHAIYCDDFRAEVGNKISLMGAYGLKLFLPSFPITLPKLCVMVSAVTGMADPFRALTVRIRLDDSVLFEQALDLTEAAKVDATGGAVDASSRCQVHTTAIVLSPLVVPAPGVLRVRVQTEKEELAAPALAIALSPQ